MPLTLIKNESRGFGPPKAIAPLDRVSASVDALKAKLRRRCHGPLKRPACKKCGGRK